VGEVDQLDIVLLGGGVGALADDVPEGVARLRMGDHGDGHLLALCVGPAGDKRGRASNGAGCDDGGCRSVQSVHQVPPISFAPLWRARAVADRAAKSSRTDSIDWLAGAGRRRSLV